jgi:hypothetical protein
LNSLCCLSFKLGMKAIVGQVTGQCSIPAHRQLCAKPARKTAFYPDNRAQRGIACGGKAEGIVIAGHGFSVPRRKR